MLSLQFQKSSSRSFHFLAVRCSRISWTDADALIDNDVVLQKVGRQKVDFKSKEVGNTINAMKTGCYGARHREALHRGDRSLPPFSPFFLATAIGPAKSSPCSRRCGARRASSVILF
jgi:hypothetical protein